jgi:Fe-S-cluster-containing hydrogenase component 2
MFRYEEDGEELMVWCPGVILKVLKKDKDGAQVVVKWDQCYEEDGEELMVWCPGVIIKVLKKDKDGAKVVVKWDQQYIGENK